MDPEGTDRAETRVASGSARSDAGDGDGRRRRGRGEQRAGRVRGRIGRVVLLLVVALVVAALFTDIGDPGPVDDSSSSSPSSGSQGEGDADGDLPTDVEHPRPTVDLATIPDPATTDPTTLARWWAATFTAYVGAAVPASLAARLAPVSTPELVAGLNALPPAASYDDAPVPIEGASSPAPIDDPAVGGSRVRVSVETPGALVVYDLVVVQDPAGWLVSTAVRV